MMEFSTSDSSISSGDIELVEENEENEENVTEEISQYLENFEKSLQNCDYILVFEKYSPCTQRYIYGSSQLKYPSSEHITEDMEKIVRKSEQKFYDNIHDDRFRPPIEYLSEDISSVVIPFNDESSLLASFEFFFELFSHNTTISVKDQPPIPPEELENYRKSSTIIEKIGERIFSRKSLVGTDNEATIDIYKNKDRNVEYPNNLKSHFNSFLEDADESNNPEYDDRETSSNEGADSKSKEEEDVERMEKSPTGDDDSYDEADEKIRLRYVPWKFFLCNTTLVVLWLCMWCFWIVFLAISYPLLSDYIVRLSVVAGVCVFLCPLFLCVICIIIFGTEIAIEEVISRVGFEYRLNVEDQTENIDLELKSRNSKKEIMRLVGYFIKMGSSLSYFVCCGFWICVVVISVVFSIDGERNEFPIELQIALPIAITFCSCLTSVFFLILCFLGLGTQITAIVSKEYNEMESTSSKVLGSMFLTSVLIRLVSRGEYKLRRMNSKEIRNEEEGNEDSEEIQVDTDD